MSGVNETLAAYRLPELNRGSIDAVVFDMDGVLLDSERLDRRLWQSVAIRRGFSFPDHVHAALVGRREEECLTLLGAHFGAQVDITSLYRELEAVWQDEVLRSGIPLKAGVHRMLNLLDAHHIPKAIATSTRRSKALQSLGPLAVRFDVIACGDEVPQGKPAPDVYLRAAAILDVAPRRCLALEDSIHGLQSASSAGMIVVMIPDLLDAPPDAPYVCGSLDGVAAEMESALACDPNCNSLIDRSAR